MTLYGNWLWEGLSGDTKPTLEDGARNGQIFKELDTGNAYLLRKGVWVNMSAGMSFVKATKSGKITTGTDGVYDVTFNTPFVDADYSVALSGKDGGSTNPTNATWDNIATTGFTIQTRSSRTGLGISGVEVSWLATKNYDP